MRMVTMVRILVLGLCGLLVFRCESLVIPSKTWMRRDRCAASITTSSSDALVPHSLQKVVLVVPQKTLGEEYETALYAQVAKEKVVRWYVSRISGGTADIEAIVEEKGVGNSAITYKAE